MERNFTVVEGRSIVLKCPAYGTPPPNIVWLKGNKVRCAYVVLYIVMLPRGKFQIESYSGDNLLSLHPIKTWASDKIFDLNICEMLSPILIVYQMNLSNEEFMEFRVVCS